MAQQPICLLSLIIFTVNSVTAFRTLPSSSLFNNNNAFPDNLSLFSGHCRHSSLLTSLSRTQSIKEIETDDDDCDTHIFLRFSPLIGGPAFLPLHVELIFAIEGANTSEQRQLKQNMDAICIRTTNNLSSTSILKECVKLHRFDFLPKNPTDPSTLARLSTLRAVPGRVRHRIYERQIDEGSNNIQIDDDEKNSKSPDGKGITVLIPFGYFPHAKNDQNMAANNDSVATAMQFKEDYSDTLFKELQVLGGKNCLSFVLDLLSHVESSATGIQKVGLPYKFNME